MTETQKELVQNSFEQLVPISEETAATFYARLFGILPEVKPLFKGNMKEQGRKLMQMIGYAVSSLDNLDVLIPAVKELGKRHVDYGVTPAHYASVGEALIWTIQQKLGDDFTPETKESWITVYTILAQCMCEDQ